MVFKEAFTLQDGRTVTVRDLSPREDPRKMRDYINEIVGEDPYLTMDKKVSLAEEKKWIKERTEGARRGKGINLVAVQGGRIVGTCFARRDRGREEVNVTLGISIAKDFRGAGLGYHMLQTIIGLSRRRLKPQMIYLSHLGPNKAARELYETLGFREVARLPQWTPHGGKRLDKVFMVLKK